LNFIETLEPTPNALNLIYVVFFLIKNVIILEAQKQITQYKGLAVFGHSFIYNITMYVFEIEYILKLMKEKLDIYLKLIYVNMNILKYLYVNWSPHIMADHEDI